MCFVVLLGANDLRPRETMSQVAAATGQVIMHPVVSKSLKIWATTLGRDKVNPETASPRWGTDTNHSVG
jgi:hypothetical protein